MGQAIAHNEAIEHLNLSWNHLRRKVCYKILVRWKVDLLRGGGGVARDSRPEICC